MEYMFTVANAMADLEAQVCAYLAPPDCGWFRHDWDEGDDTLGGACCTSTTRYTCRTCGKVKERTNGMG